MQQAIFDPDDKFQFNDLMLMKPILTNGGNYFIKFLNNNSPLYIQPPKCRTRQGIAKGSKRMFTDLMFTNENNQFIQWMEKLETHCHDFIYKNREQWFDGDLEMHDIENYFTAPLKIFKSGKFYVLRTNISNVLGKPSLKIYDENEIEINYEYITDATDIMTILEIQGIKCSARSFHIEIELKQMMVIKPVNLFEKCIIKTKPLDPVLDPVLDPINKEVEDIISEDAIKDSKDIFKAENTIETPQDIPVTPFSSSNSISVAPLSVITADKVGVLNDQVDEPPVLELNEIVEEKLENSANDMEEIQFNLDELKETVQIKERNDVYYEMYREARRKAKIARGMALSSYLEAKRIKTTYMLEDIDSEDSDIDFNDEK